MLLSALSRKSTLSYLENRNQAEKLYATLLIPVLLTVNGRPFLSNTTSEQVASNPIPFIFSFETKLETC